MSENANEFRNVYTETPLHDYRRSSGEHASVIVREQSLRGHLVIRGDSACETFSSAIHCVLGMRLPVDPCTYASLNESYLFWLGPNEWLLVEKLLQIAELETQLRNKLTGHFALVDVSGGQTMIKLSGADVGTLLMKASPYDFHPANFAPGQCVQTIFAKSTALVSSHQDDSFNLVIRRSFSAYLGRWLLDAGATFA